MPENQEHEYTVTIRTDSGESAYRVTSAKSIEDYRASLLSGLNGIITPSTPIGESIHVTERNLVNITEADGDAVVEPAGSGFSEQETNKIKELLGSSTNLPCSHCKIEYEMHAGDNVCPNCDERTFVPAVETSN